MIADANRAYDYEFHALPVMTILASFSPKVSLVNPYLPDETQTASKSSREIAEEKRRQNPEYYDAETVEECLAAKRKLLAERYRKHGMQLPIQ